ncbi:hypothetical protein [Adlercreutzia sp. ZJ304]|uniref:hypothetical protein n=1 Tax=Adlercreutzia sp. ZJ304 TaxID=2709791 RepID=UPI001F14E7F0|nr:hypothetical protein [Adlercreutzia sp. ZJ304]
MNTKVAVWVVRIAFFIVFAWNVMCAVQFICWPSAYIGAYQLQGGGAAAAIQGLGVAFLMWNATYPAFIWRPLRFKALGVVILVQQAIGLCGELFIASTLDASLQVLSQSIARFVGFDAIGLVIMAVAFHFLRKISSAASA